jgi:hypothetical protein
LSSRVDEWDIIGKNQETTPGVPGCDLFKKEALAGIQGRIARIGGTTKRVRNDLDAPVRESRDKLLHKRNVKIPKALLIDQNQIVRARARACCDRKEKAPASDRFLNALLDIKALGGGLNGRSPTESHAIEDLRRRDRWRFWKLQRHR